MIAAVSPAIYLLALACPVGMGLMMWFMGRGMMGGRNQLGGPPTDKQSLADLKAEQARLAEKIEALGSNAGGPPKPSAASDNGDEAEQAERATAS